MNFNPFTEKELNFLNELIGRERISTGQSYLDLHSVDEANNKGPLPEVVVWPRNAEEVSSILKMAN